MMDFCEHESSLVLYSKFQASKIYMVSPGVQKKVKKSVEDNHM